MAKRLRFAPTPEGPQPIRLTERAEGLVEALTIGGGGYQAVTPRAPEGYAFVGETPGVHFRPLHHAMPAKPQPQLLEVAPVEREVREAITAFQKGIDPEKNFQLLVKQFYRPVFRFLARWDLSEQDRLDITQEVFLRVYKGLKDYRGASRFSTWIFGIAHNACMRWFSRSAAGRALSSLQSEELDDEEFAGKTSLLLDDQLGELLAREKHELLRKAISDLPGQMRRCVELHIYQDLRYHEIATVLRLSTGTVKAHLFQAREKLRDRLSRTLAGENL